jgi:hypothetical protein
MALQSLEVGPYSPSGQLQRKCPSKCESVSTALISSSSSAERQAARRAPCRRQAVPHQQERPNRAYCLMREYECSAQMESPSLSSSVERGSQVSTVASRTPWEGCSNPLHHELQLGQWRRAWQRNHNLHVLGSKPPSWMPLRSECATSTYVLATVAEQDIFDALHPQSLQQQEDLSATDCGAEPDGYQMAEPLMFDLEL